MEVQWFRVEPLTLGPPPSAVGITLSFLFGNATHLWSSPFNLLHLHYFTARMHDSFTSPPLFSLNFSIPSPLKPDGTCTGGT